MGVSNGKRPWPCEHRSGPSYLSSPDSDHGEENSDGSTSEGPSHTGQFGPASVLTCKIVIMLDSYMILALRPRPSAKLLKVALGDQALNISLPNIELAVLGEIDSPTRLLVS